MRTTGLAVTLGTLIAGPKAMAGIILAEMGAAAAATLSLRRFRLWLRGLFRRRKKGAPSSKKEVKPPRDTDEVKPPKDTDEVKPGKPASDVTQDIGQLVYKKKDGTFRLNRKRIQNSHKIKGEPESLGAAEAAREAYAAERAAQLKNVERVYVGTEADGFINPASRLGTEVSADVVAVTRQGQCVLIEAKGMEILHGLQQLEYSAVTLGYQRVIRYELVIPERISTPGFFIKDRFLHLHDQPYLIFGKKVRVHLTKH